MMVTALVLEAFPICYMSQDQRNDILLCQIIQELVYEIEIPVVGCSMRSNQINYQGSG